MLSCPQSLRPSDTVRPRPSPQRPFLTYPHCSKRPRSAVHRSAVRRLRGGAMPNLVLQRQTTEPWDMCEPGLHPGRHRLPTIADCPRKQPRSVLCDVLYHKWNLHGHWCYNRVVYVPSSALYLRFLIPVVQSRTTWVQRRRRPPGYHYIWRSGNAAAFLGLTCSLPSRAQDIQRASLCPARCYSSVRFAPLS